VSKRKPIENLVRLPSEGSGPVWTDTVGNAYPEVRDAFMHLLRLVFLTVTVRERELPPAQRHVNVKNIPDVKAFYPCGIMASYVQIPPEQQEAINDLYMKIGEAICKASDEGNKNGRALLFGLARGEITVSDFDAGAVAKPKEDEDNMKDEQLIKVIDAIPQQPQRQYSADEQLQYLCAAANKLGLYDAADRLDLGREKP
jgi:hypothetical protein